MEFHYILILQGNAGEDVTNWCFLGSDHRWTRISFCSFGWTPDGLCWIVGLYGNNICLQHVHDPWSPCGTPDYITVMRGKCARICANSFD